VKDADLRETLSRIQDIILRRTGVSLGDESAAQIEALLRSANGNLARSLASEPFVSRDVTILLADLRGFTQTSAAYPVASVLDMLNRFLVRMSQVIARHQGTIDKFMGDSIMALFGAPVAHPDDVEQALACAVEMQIGMGELNAYHGQLGLPELYMGIGINTGTVMAGSIGSDLYSAYTVIGDEVNLASRIESFSLRGQILISQATYDRCADLLITGGPMEVLVKGKAEPVSLREILAIPSLHLEVPRQEIRQSPRVEVKIPFTYQPVRNKIVIPERRQGTILDIGYHGLLVELDGALAPHSEIKLDLDLSLIGSRVTDVYAKIVKDIDRDGRHLNGIQFTSVTVQGQLDIRHFVQLLIQGSETA